MEIVLGALNSIARRYCLMLRTRVVFSRRPSSTKRICSPLSFMYDVLESALSDYLRPDWSNACINVRTEEAYETAHEVLRAEGLFLGTSAAAALRAAVQVGRRPENQGKNIVVIVSDNGMKYLSTPMYRQK